MLRTRLTSSVSLRQMFRCMALAAVVVLPMQSAWALIMGGEGNKPLNDPGWPKGAAAVFNTETRVAWWEGPPFGGGQWHAECKGDAAALSLVLDDFARVDVPKKRVVLHDGFGHSFWLNPNNDKDKAAKALIDWTFMVWQADRLKMQQGLPAQFRAAEKDALLAQIDVYTGGFVRWADVIVPEGLEIIDERLEAHGFKVTDGTVIEGIATDLATKKPIKARLILESMEPQSEGGGAHPQLVEVSTDDKGRWVVKNAPTAWCRLVLHAEGYVPRIIGYDRFDDKPRWSQRNGGLSKPAPVSGRVLDDKGQPLADVDVRLDHDATSLGRYETLDSSVKTDAQGRFRMENVPIGTSTIWIHKSGYVRPGLGLKVDTPASEVKLTMQLSSKLQVRVDFSDTKRPEGYIVHVEPEGGQAVGKWSGSGNIDADGQITYEHIPPGRYMVHGRPNPGSDSEQTETTAVDLKPGKLSKVTIKAK